MRAVCCLFPLVFGCYPPPDCAEGAPRNDAGKCTVTTGGDDTGLQDTGEVVTADFSGPIQIGILAETSALVIEDVCEGTVQLTVEGTAVDGTLSCVFGGTVGGIIGSDPFVGTISGEVAQDGSASGPLDMDLAAFGALAATWSGTVNAQGIDGTFGEETIFVVGALEVPVIYDGSFSAR
jgi:hypothetical protein